MAERYSKLFSLPNSLYATGAPVVISAGALLKDTQTGKIIAQLKIQNIGAKSIKAATVCIYPCDIKGNSLESEVEYQYLDLDASRGKDFGSKIPVVLPNLATRSFSVSVTEVICADSSVWSTNGEPWKPLDRLTPLDISLTDPELVNQFRIKYGINSQYMPSQQDDLWYCTCGAINHKNETNCHSCHKSASVIFSVNLDDLRFERDTRLVAEHTKAEADKAVAEAKAKKIKISVIAIASVLILVIGTVFTLNAINANKKYDSALALMRDGQYEQAIVEFTALGDYKDSIAQIEESQKLQEQKQIEEKYHTALALLGDREYKEALTVFEEISNYKDSADYIVLCQGLIKLLDAEQNFAGSWRWGAASYNESNYIYFHEYNSFEKFYVDFKNYTITLTFSSPTTQFEKVSEFRIVSATRLAFDSFHSSNTLYLDYEDGQVFVSAKDKPGRLEWLRIEQ